MNDRAPRKIALVGTAGSGKLAPYGDESYEIWGVSGRAAYVTRVNRWFELHRLDGEDPEWAKTWRETIKSWSSDIPELYMLYPEPDLGNVVQYPIDRIIHRFGTFFMTSTFSWMSALAIDELAPHGSYAVPGDTIAIFGVDMEYGTEYVQQRGGFRHFIQLAKHLGINVELLATGGMSYEPIPYPMWQDDPLLSKVSARITEAANNLDNLEGSQRTTREVIASTRAAMREVEHWREVLGDEKADERLAYLGKTLDNAAETSARISKDIVSNDAVLQERRWLKDYLTP